MFMISYIFLACALVLLSLNKVKTAYLILVLSVFCAYYFNIINMSFFISNMIAFLLVLFYKYKKSLFLELILFAFCIVLFLHFIPGVNNTKILDQVYASVNSAPFSLYFNFDKPLGVFILFLLLPALFINKLY
ncbi:hypothetical protein [Campylobacter hepaticus]|uniref:hypothetical protein n=1 Tax=Campylobacter hepaticus TaxID=1813019 RepID=UPI0027D23C06|nr:hypothetical protein [Campylobacter hepaticus]